MIDRQRSGAEQVERAGKRGHHTRNGSPLTGLAVRDVAEPRERRGCVPIGGTVGDEQRRGRFQLGPEPVERTNAGIDLRHGPPSGLDHRNAQVRPR